MDLRTIRSRINVHLRWRDATAFQGWRRPGDPTLTFHHHMNAVMAPQWILYRVLGGR